MAKLKTKGDPSTLAGTKAGSVFAGAKVKDAVDRLSSKKYEVKGRDGNPLKWGNRVCETASEKELATIGVWWKSTMKRAGVPGIVFSDFEPAYFTKPSRRASGTGK